MRELLTSIQTPSRSSYRATFPWLRRINRNRQKLLFPEVRVEQIYLADDPTSRRLRTQVSYQKALGRYRTLRGLSRISWVTWSIVLVTIAIWCVTAYQAALAAGAHSLHDVLSNIVTNAVNVQDKDNDAIATVLIT